MISTRISYIPSFRNSGKSVSSSNGNQYSLTLVNNSTDSFTFFVYQQPPIPSTHVFSTAWFASPYEIGPGSQIQFQWYVNFDFFWADSGQIKPGVTFSSQGMVSADPQNGNNTSFSVAQGPSLTTPVAGNPQGSLVIADDADVPSDQYSVGLGMAGVGTYFVQAGPNLTHTFTPTPTYWIAAGSDVTVGTVLDITTINNPIQAVFPANEYSLTYSLNSENLWNPVTS